MYRPETRRPESLIVNSLPGFRCRTHRVSDLVMFSAMLALIVAFLAFASNPHSPEQVEHTIVAQSAP